MLYFLRVVYMRNANLLYTLINYNIEPYLEMMKVFFESIDLFTPSPNFDVVIITDAETKQAIKRVWRPPEKFRVRYLIVSPAGDLYHALIRKCDIARYESLLKYEKVLYLDFDIIVQKDLSKLFDDIKAKPDVLYAPKEGEIDGQYWTLDLYTNSDIARLKQKRVNSFNTGTFLFVPSPTMKEHLMNVRRLAELYDRQNKNHFYDQSFFNYYFNMNGISSTKYITKHVKIFPKHDQLYPARTILHFAGLRRYNEKAGIMRNYLRMLMTSARSE